MSAAENLIIKQGKPFRHVLQYMGPDYTYKAITAITQTAPARVTATGHGIPDGWPVAIVSVKGMREINAENDPPRDRDFHDATVIDANTVEFNDINAAGFHAYTSGGYLQFLTPVDLSGTTVQMVVKDKAGGTVLATWTSAAGQIAIDNASKTITVTLAESVVNALAWTRGVYDLEITDSLGADHPLMSGSIIVEKW